MRSNLAEMFPEVTLSHEALEAYEAGRVAKGQQQYRQAIAFFETVLAYADGTTTALKAHLLNRRGNCYWHLGQYEEAAYDFQTALELSEEPSLQARLQARLGEVADARGRYDEAFQLYQTALEQGMATNDIMAIGLANRGLGIVHRRQGNAEKAIFHLKQALAAYQQAGEALEQARVLTSLGRTRHARGEYHQAISAHQEALQIVREVGDRWRIALSLNDLGECYQTLYDMERAIHYHRQALQIVEEELIEVIEPDVKRNMGINLVGQGQLAEGIGYLHEALTMAEKFGNREQQALALYALAQAYINQRELARAETTVTTLGHIADELDADRYRALAAFRRGELLLAKGEKVTAIAEMQLAMLAAQTSLDRGILWKLHATMSHIGDDQAISAIHRTIAIDFIEQTISPMQDEQLKKIFVKAPPVYAILTAAGIDPDELLRRY